MSIYACLEIYVQWKAGLGCVGVQLKHITAVFMSLGQRERFDSTKPARAPAICKLIFPEHREIRLITILIEIFSLMLKKENFN